VDNTLQWKLNNYEADVVASLVTQLREHYKHENLEWHKNSVGVITPYKAQIALIKSKIPDFDDVTVDSVERYQGGARDIILFSVCTNKPSQMNALVSLNADGVDRKLNVAITRAREQLIIIGNREIMEKDKNYKALISQCEEL
ncbi:MAG: C-terminal helicase domain-containing protein, partial [Saprospiraceae bacterium]